LSQRADGAFTIGFSDAETAEPLPFFDVRLQQYDPSGAAIGASLIVNEAVSVDQSTEGSAAVAFRDNNVVVTWISRQPEDCPPSKLFRVYARRLHWNAVGSPQFIGHQFIVDSDPDWAPVGLDSGNPTVALGPDSEFIIGWNAVSGGFREVHAQYFKTDGDCIRPMGREFRVHQEVDTSVVYALGDSAQHTCGFRSDSGVVFVFTRGLNLATPVVHFTILPAGFAEALESTPGAGCLKDDCNRDGDVDGDDIQPFVKILFAAEGAMFECNSLVENCPADVNSDGAVTVADVPPFICILLGLPANCAGGPACFGGPIRDCNGNGIDDVVDIYQRSSADCNANGDPDECDIASETSPDVNANGVPDECEPDCNHNVVPDDQDLADQTSYDVNGNAVPDECEPDCNGNSVPDAWDIAQSTSADCNASGVPDECEGDCNENGVPDDCDITQQTSPDCNGNWIPDECDLVRPLLPSYDCNANGIPDECDIAELTSADCNANGIPDECDIATQISQDENENGIPDECEEGMMMGGPGEGASTGSATETDFDESAAWAAFYDWQVEQADALGAMTAAERFTATIAKLRDLGLPPSIPWAAIERETP
jgi:hypothetical protein